MTKSGFKLSVESFVLFLVAFLFIFWLMNPHPVNMPFVKLLIKANKSFNVFGENKTKTASQNSKSAAENTNHEVCLCTYVQLLLDKFRNLDTAMLINRENASDTSTCRATSKKRGFHQNVVSYTLYGNPKDEFVSRTYFREAINRVKDVSKQYPGWTVRLYHNLSADDTAWHTLCSLGCNSPHLDLCNMSAVPQSQAIMQIDVSNIKTKMMWRFLPLLDPLVDKVLMRDLDSPILDREVDAVGEWLHSNLTYHVMRDHPNHKGKIYPGMFGVKLYQERKEIFEKIKSLLSETTSNAYYFDMFLLEKSLWPYIKNKCMVHDSYHCANEDMRGLINLPYPTQRVGNTFIGNGERMIEAVQLINSKECPYACRPKFYKNWKFC